MKKIRFAVISALFAAVFSAAMNGGASALSAQAVREQASAKKTFRLKK